MKPEASESSEDEEWEEVEESQIPDEEVKPSESVEVTLDLPAAVKKKQKREQWEREMVEVSIRRAVKRYNKDMQLVMHKVHLLCLLALGMRMNRVCCDQELHALAFSLLPERYTNTKKNHVSAIFLTRLIQDFTKVFRFENGVEGLINSGLVRWPKIKALLHKALEKRELKFRIDLVMVLVLALRAMGIHTRLVLSLQPIHLKVLTEKQKEAAAKTKKGNTIEVKKDQKTRKRVSSIPQVDGSNDSPPKRMTRSKSRKTESNNKDGEYKTPIKNSKNKKETASQNDPKEDADNISVTNSKKVVKKTTRKKNTKISAVKTENTLGIDETPISKPLLEEKVKRKLTNSRNTRKRKVVSVVDKADSDLDFSPVVSSDDEDSDFELEPSKSRRSLKTDFSKNPKSTSATVPSSDDSDFDFKQKKTPKKKIDSAKKITKSTSKPQNLSGHDKPRKISSRRSTDNAKHCSDDFWLEVYSEQERQWICVDVFRNAINYPDQMEKHASPPLHYVLGFDNEGHVKDITARYSSKWLTDTRKLRVGIADKDWWKDTLAPYATKNKERDQLENKDMQQKLLTQPIPTTISAFKNHPLFRLRRHLLKYEAIYPADIPAVGLIRGEEIFPRSAIHTLHTRDKWMQEARVVKDGEEPYKMVASLWINMKLKQDMSTLSMPLFGRWQTEPFIPPVARDGLVPRNQYGNVDLFRPSMIPVGCVRMRLPGLQKIAKKLNIDIAVAITGFDSHSGYPHPVTDGFVVCQEFEETLTAAWQEDQVHAAERERKKIEERVYKRWKFFIKAMIAKERVNRKYAKKKETVDREDQSDQVSVQTGTAWQSKRLRAARSKAKSVKRGREDKNENLLPFEVEAT